MVREITFVTGNANKLREVQQILNASGDAQWTLTSRELDVSEVQGTTQQVALAKCRSAALQLQGPCLTEDTALLFHGMRGLPGPYIKDFLKGLGLHGLNKMLQGFEDKSATALCTFAFSHGPGHEPVLFEGATQGTIVPPRGETQFGWDPIFEAAESGKTFAEMDGAEKNAVCCHVAHYRFRTAPAR
ncbi:adenylate kinase [Malassezia vespertilionis]|uniref:Inosine triphosphate pyrophosphatase n=1 Tax=Malassezia vespertilionis TaxID=2020962 RepID=A0A2N1J7E9_9BASI|nr:adenylate kinase [Malassezia vespertilionis]PKI82392.1 Ham1p [Malassezia vespertilionis]WFD08001.1 adenylate kinase [Malassezia vespertilionis]